MNILEYIVSFIIGAAFGCLITWFFAKSKFSKEFLEISKELSSALSRLEHMEGLKKALEERTRTIDSLNAAITELKEHQARLETIIDKERLAVNEKIEMLEDLRNNMIDAYKAISVSALKENNQTFLDLAKTTFSRYMDVAKSDFNVRSKEVKNIVVPIKDSLDRYDQHIQAMERSREQAYGGLSQQILSLAETQQTLQKETGKLVKALRVPHVRGRWGEITLKRVAELAGMQNRCDFFEQQSAYDENGIMRPDMVVYLPGNRQIVVDAKAPLSAYLEALEAETEEDREVLIAAHSKQIQSHMHKLARKTYWKQFAPTPEFVVLFIPGENFFSAALVKNPKLIEEGVNKGVILATPTTLIALLKTVAFAWRQENVSENAKAISELGRELYTRLNLMANHFDKLGRDIERCTNTYNQVVGSFERRVLISARKFKELGISLPGDKDIVHINPVEKKARKLETDSS